MGCTFTGYMMACAEDGGVPDSTDFAISRISAENILLNVLSEDTYLT